MVNVIQFIETIRKGELPSESDVEKLCDLAEDMLLEQPNVVNVDPPITVVGDIHGQFYDLLELFHVGGECPSTRYLFLGDYVDRGYYSVETFLFLLALKVHYPNEMILLRGNHESRQITQVYGFYDECVRKFGSLNIWDRCTRVFDCLPLAAVVAGKVFCVHGGLSPSLSTVDEIRKLDRQQEAPHDGLMCDLLWSDPMDGETPISEDLEKDEANVLMKEGDGGNKVTAQSDVSNGWNLSPRGAGYLFGQDVTSIFLRQNDFSFICRAHQLVFNGYMNHFDGKVFTVWSAPNYTYRIGNIASIMRIDENLDYEFTTFEAAPMEKRGPLMKKPIVEYFL
ncbi:hypothetical protein RCL1_005113 [Eukaryota sp. TZLM3-RCL]